MSTMFRRWRTERRYRATVHALRSLTARQLGELGIAAVEIHRLARAAATV